MKICHRLSGSPVWIMVIGASSSGKSEYLKAFTNDSEITIDDLTTKTFVSGTNAKLKEVTHLAERLNGKIWYIYDLSILMSKKSEDRSQILSDMRMIYDGKIVKEFGTGFRIEVETGNNTLICGTTPVIDNTMIEDQMLGTRFLMYRPKSLNRQTVMEKIDEMEKQKVARRGSLSTATSQWENSIEVENIELNEVEVSNLKVLCNVTTLMRASGSFDRSGELNNIVYPEDPPRFYNQIKKLYMAYRIIGLTEEEALKYIRNICISNINPIRMKLIKWLVDNTYKSDMGQHTVFSTSKIHSGTGIGKKTIKSHLFVLNHLGVVNFWLDEELNKYQAVDQWKLADFNLNILFDKVKIKHGKTLARIMYATRHRNSGSGGEMW